MRRIRARSRLHGSPYGMPRLPRRRHPTMTQERLFSIPQFSTTSDDYYTPKWIFDALGLEFDLDVACPPEGPLNTPCKHYYTQETDGLASVWFGTVWMNPPFSNTIPWVHKWIKHGDGIALLPDTNRKWRTQLYEQADGIVALPAQMKFVAADGRRTDIRYSTCLYSMGNPATEALKASNIGRVR